MDFMKRQPWATDFFEQLESIRQKMEDLIDNGKDKFKHDEDDVQDGQQICEDTEKPKSILLADQVDPDGHGISAVGQDEVKVNDHLKSVGRRLCSSVLHDECSLDGCSEESSVGDEHGDDLLSMMVSTVETINVSSKSQRCIDTSSSDTSATVDTVIKFSRLCRFEDLSHEVEANMCSRMFSGEDNITNSEPTVANSSHGSKISDEDCEEGNLSAIEQQLTFSEFHGWISYSSESGCLLDHELPMLGHVISDEAPSSSLSQKTSADVMDQALKEDACDLSEDCILIHGSNVGSFGSRHNEELHGHSAQTSSFPHRIGEKFGFDSAIHYSKMETIELSPASTVKPPYATAMAVHGTAHFSHHRRKGFSYFKKLIKDRLTSRSRLSKEYQLLHIYHDAESSNNVDTTTVVPLEMTENDWELV